MSDYIIFSESMRYGLKETYRVRVLNIDVGREFGIFRLF